MTVKINKLIVGGNNPDKVFWNNTANGHTFRQNTGLLTDYTNTVTNNSTISQSTIAKADGNVVNTVSLYTPINNPQPVATLIKDNQSIQLANDNAIPMLLSFYCDRLPAGTNLQLYPWISNAAGVSSANRCRGVFPTAIDTIGWTTIAIDKRISSWDSFSPHFEQQGTAAFNFANPMVSYRIQLSGDVSLDSKIARIHGFGEGHRERPKVCLTFDDSKPTGYSIGYKEAKKRNITSSHFAIFDSLGATGMSLAQITEIANDPLCYVGLHGNSRFDGAGSGAGTTPIGEMTRNIVGLKALGLSDCRYLAWPEGQLGQTSGTALCIDVAKSLGIIGARHTQQGYQWFNGGLYNPYCIRSLGLKSTLTLTQAKEAIDRCIEWGTSVTFYAHDFGAAADSITWVTQDYIDLLDYIALKRSLGLIDDMRFNDFMEYGKTIL